MNLYVASSWRNQKYPAVLEALRGAGHTFYDFRNPPESAGFSWREIEPGWEKWSAARFREMLEHPDAKAGFNADYKGMVSAEGCVLVMPCGRSAHLEAGFFWGSNRPLFILLENGEPELMYRAATALCVSTDELLLAIKSYEAARKRYGGVFGGGQ